MEETHKRFGKLNWEDLFIEPIKIAQEGFVVSPALHNTLQYMRYIPYLRDQGITVSFCAQKKLHTLIKSSAIDPNPLTPDQANSISEGQWSPLLSLSRYLQVNPNNPIIGNRSFGQDKYNVVSKATALMQGLHEAGILTLSLIHI